MSQIPNTKETSEESALKIHRLSHGMFVTLYIIIYSLVVSVGYQLAKQMPGFVDWFVSLLALVAVIMMLFILLISWIEGFGIDVDPPMYRRVYYANTVAFLVSALVSVLTSQSQKGLEIPIPIKGVAF